MKKAIIFYVPMWLVWALWSMMLLPLLPNGVFSAIADSVAVKAVVWVLPFIIFTKYLKPKRLFAAPFPWLVCLIALCASAVFLHTVRLINGLMDTHVVFDPMFIVFSLSAGVFEELSFRGGFQAALEESIGFLPAALINSVMFTLYHFPGLLYGQWQELISLRGLLIFVMGVVFCWMFRRWKNLALNMTVHTVWDILSYLFCLAG